MSVRKVRFLLRLGISALLGVTLIFSGCARFDSIVDFAASPTSGKKPLLVQFTPAVEGNARRYVWNFGDGNTSAEQSPEHTYTDAGTYGVILTVVPRQGEPTSVMKADYISVQSGFGGSPSSMVVEDDDFALSPGSASYMLEVLENDIPGDGSAGLTIIGVSTYGGDYDDYECETAAGYVIINPDGTVIEYEPYTESSDMFYYLATDGQTTAQGEVWIDYSTGAAHMTVQDDTFVIGGSNGVPTVWNPDEGTCYELNVLNNDVSGSGEGLTIVGVSRSEGSGYGEWQSMNQGYAYISPDGKAIHYQVYDYDEPFDTIYYRATDGWVTAVGEVSLAFDLHWYDD